MHFACWMARPPNPFVGRAGMTQRVENHVGGSCRRFELVEILLNHPLINRASVVLGDHQIEILVLIPQELNDFNLRLLPLPKNIPFAITRRSVSSQKCIEQTAAFAIMTRRPLAGWKMPCACAVPACPWRAFVGWRRLEDSSFRSIQTVRSYNQPASKLTLWSKRDII